MRSRIVAYVLFPIIVIVQFLVYYASSRYGAVCEELAVAVCQTSWGEILNYLNFKSSVWFCCVPALCYCCAYGIRRMYSDRKIKYRLSVLLFGSVLCAVAYTVPIALRYSFPFVAAKLVKCYVVKDPWRLSYPIQRTSEEVCLDMLQNCVVDEQSHYDAAYVPAWDSYLYFRAMWKFYNPVELKSSDSARSWVKLQGCPQVVAFYIGESFRADHNPMNGYARNTMPRVSRMPNIINLPNLFSYETQTISSIYSLLVLKDSVSRKPTHTSFIDILVKHGYSAYLMVGANTEGSWYNTPQIASQLDGRVVLYSRPKSFDGYSRGIFELMNQDKCPLFIMIEDGAGHMPYKSTSYPFGTRTPIDCYDNALVDIDRTVADVIDCMKDKYAIVFFTSDHGESFGENGRWGHGGPKTAKEQLHVAGFIWYSDSYAEKYPDVVRHLKENAEKFTSLDYAYHTIISMCGISSELQIPSQDMTRPQE